MTVAEEASQLHREFIEEGFVTYPFPQLLRAHLLTHIQESIRKLGSEYNSNPNASLLELAMSVPDAVWAHKMGRAFRFFPAPLAKEILNWTDRELREKFGRKCCATNVIFPSEIEINPNLKPTDLAIYWRCVRPGKPDAGRPHRDSGFWELEFSEGYDPKIPFSFNYLKDCLKIWIPISGCIPETTLQVIPRSHRMEIPTIVEDTEYGRRPTISSQWLKDNNHLFISPRELSEGSCIIFDMDLVHRGPAHAYQDLRISADFNFILN